MENIQNALRNMKLRIAGYDYTKTEQLKYMGEEGLRDMIINTFRRLLVPEYAT